MDNPHWLSPPCSPPLDRQHQDRPGHQESRKAHRDSEDEHGIKVVILHRGNSVLVTGHEDETPRDEAERGDDLRRRAGREVGRRWREVGQDVGDRARQGEAHEEGAPLLVDHG